MKITIWQSMLVLLGTWFFASACTQEDDPATPPTAGFEFDTPDSVTLEVQFRNTSENAQTFYWDFGDGQASTLKNPKHQYIQSGVYPVRLQAISQTGTNNTTKTVHVFAFPRADFAFVSAGCTASCDVYFENRSVNADSFLWDFGDGERSTEMNPNHTYTRGGIFTVRLTATGKTGTARFAKTIQIQDSIVAPIADFDILGGDCQAPCEVEFRNKSKNATDYSWDFGDGIQSRVENPKYTFKKHGIYTIRLIAKGEGGKDETVRTLNIQE